MDLPISCQAVHYIYKHPLSILIHQKFQDKDGCSKNGSREVLIEIGERSGTRDSRGVLVFLFSYNPSRFSLESEEAFFHFKTLSCNINSSIPIVQEEREPMKQLYMTNESRLILKMGRIDIWYENPAVLWYISSACGHVIGYRPHLIEDYIKFNSENTLTNLSSLEQLPHFRMLKCTINELSQDNLDFEENFGRILGSKLIHLSIYARETPTLSQLEHCLDQFTKLNVVEFELRTFSFLSNKIKYSLCFTNLQEFSFSCVFYNFSTII